MKPSPTVLLFTVILVLLATGLFVSNVLLKKEHDKVDISNLNQTYGETYLFAKYEF